MSIKQFKDESGMRYGRLTVVERASVKRHPKKRTGAIWRCMCDCGQQTFAAGRELRVGLVRECPKCNEAWGKINAG